MVPTQVEELLPQALPFEAFVQRLAVQTLQVPQSWVLQQSPSTQAPLQTRRPRLWHVTHIPPSQNLFVPQPVMVGQFESAQSVLPSQSSSWPLLHTSVLGQQAPLAMQPPLHGMAPVRHIVVEQVPETQATLPEQSVSNI